MGLNKALDLFETYKYIYRLLYSWLYNTEIYFDNCPDDFHIGRADRRVQYGKVIWARV